MMCAIVAARAGAKVTVLERNDKIGRKLYITGKGRCNVTNCTVGQEFAQNIVSNARFLYGALSRFDSHATMDFFEGAGVPLKVERGNRVFPQSDRSADIIDALFREAQRAHVTLRLGCVVRGVEIKDGMYLVHTNNGDFTDAILVIATGGLTYPATGSTGDGYRFAEALGHTIVPTVPALVGLRATGTTALAGLALKNVSVSVERQGKVLATEFGEMLYTHTGLSGPTVLSLSSRINRLEFAGLEVVVDTKPAVTQQQLDARLMRDLSANNKQLVNAVQDYLPHALVPCWLKAAGVDPHMVANSVTKQQRAQLAAMLKHLSYPLLGLEPMEGAVVTAGGVSVGQIDPKTMQSKVHDGLYFVGEVLDIDALTGGFNLQLAFATAYSAAIDAAQKELNYD